MIFYLINKYKLYRESARFVMFSTLCSSYALEQTVLLLQSWNFFWGVMLHHIWNIYIGNYLLSSVHVRLHFHFKMGLKTKPPLVSILQNIYKYKSSFENRVLACSFF